MPDFVDGLSKLGVEVNNRQKAALRRIGGPKLFESLTKIAEDSATTTKKTTKPHTHRTRFDEHNVFNRQVGRVIERATSFDHGTKTGGYFDARGNALLKIPRCEVADHLETEPSRHHHKENVWRRALLCRKCPERNEDKGKTNGIARVGRKIWTVIYQWVKAKHQRARRLNVDRPFR